MNEALHVSPLLCREEEDAYGESCGFLWLIGGRIVSKLELEPPKSGSSPRGDDDDALPKSFL